MEKPQTTPFEPPANSIQINDLETLKVIADPLRNQIMEILAPAPLTINQIAERLGQHPSKLYYHIGMLEKHGFLRVVDTAVKGNVIEKLYWLTAYRCELDHNLWNFSTPAGQEASITSLVSVVETTRSDLERSLRARAFALERGAEEHPRKVVIDRQILHLTDEDADRVAKKLHEIFDEIGELARAEGDPEVHTRALTIAFYPSFYYEQTEQTEEAPPG